MDAQRRTKASAATRRRGSCRAAASRTGPTASEERIVYVTPGYQLVALDAKTGVRVSGFGKNGIVDLKQDDDQEIDLVTGEIGLHAAPVVAKDVIIVGAAHLRRRRARRARRNEKGYIRGFDVRTGKRLWIFHTIPQPGEFGNDTWEKDSWSYTGNTGVWAQMTVDEELGTRLPAGRDCRPATTTAAIGPGNNLFGESLVAVDLKTGKRKWHYQLVHHGIWDIDIPCAPILADITVERQADQGGRAADQAGLGLRVRSRDRPAGVADRRAAGREGRRARRVVLADAAVRHQAAAVRAAGRVDRRPDRLHAGAARRSGEARRRATRSGRSSRRRSSASGKARWRR